MNKTVREANQKFPKPAKNTDAANNNNTANNNNNTAAKKKTGDAENVAGVVRQRTDTEPDNQDQTAASSSTEPKIPPNNANSKTPQAPNDQSKSSADVFAQKFKQPKPKPKPKETKKRTVVNSGSNSTPVTQTVLNNFFKLNSDASSKTQQGK